MTMHISELPANVLSKVVAYKLGDPKYIRLKYNKKFKQIQNESKTTDERDKYTFCLGMLKFIDGITL